MYDCWTNPTPGFRVAIPNSYAFAINDHHVASWNEGPQTTKLPRFCSFKKHKVKIKLL